MSNNRTVNIIGLGAAGTDAYMRLQRNAGMYGNIQKIFCVDSDLDNCALTEISSDDRTLLSMQWMHARKNDNIFTTDINTVDFIDSVGSIICLPVTDINDTLLDDTIGHIYDRVDADYQICIRTPVVDNVLTRLQNKYPKLTLFLWPYTLEKQGPLDIVMYATNDSVKHDIGIDEQHLPELDPQDSNRERINKIIADALSMHKPTLFSICVTIAHERKSTVTSIPPINIMDTTSVIIKQHLSIALKIIRRKTEDELLSTISDIADDINIDIKRNMGDFISVLQGEFASIGRRNTEISVIGKKQLTMAENFYIMCKEHSKTMNFLSLALQQHMIDSL